MVSLPQVSFICDSIQCAFIDYSLGGGVPSAVRLHKRHPTVLGFTRPIFGISSASNSCHATCDTSHYNWGSFEYKLETTQNGGHDSSRLDTYHCRLCSSKVNPSLPHDSNFHLQILWIIPERIMATKRAAVRLAFCFLASCNFSPHPKECQP